MNLLLNLKTRLYQLDVIPGDPGTNLSKMLAAIDEARAAGIELLIFPEMAVPGYLLGDAWERPALLRECQAAGEAIRRASSGITVVFGNVAMDWDKVNEDGRVRKYNAVFVAEHGQFLQNKTTGLPYFIKTLMPNYREFDDSRYFFDPRKLAQEMQCSIEDLIQPVESRLGRLGCFLCEDGWDQDYNLAPTKILAQKGAQLLINVSCSPYTLNKNHKRNRVFSDQARIHKLPLIYVNSAGLQDNGKTLFTFDGSSCVYDSLGQLLCTLGSFEESFADVQQFEAKKPVAPVTWREDDIGTQYEAIIYGTRLFMQRVGLKKVVIGVSGGIDSALAATLYRQLLPPENLLLVSMPGHYTSGTTRNLGRELAEALECPFAEVPIAEAVELTRQQLESTQFERKGGQSMGLTVSDFVMENIQARDRSSRILAACAAAFGGAFTCNANKSEMTVGYSTLYGDLGGFLANMGDLWKGEVYAMAGYINREVYGREVIPQGTIDIVPSAELSAAHNVDEGQGDPLFYPYHDTLFRSWVERWERATPEDNLRWYLDGSLAEVLHYEGDIYSLFPDARAFIEDLERWWTLYQGMAVAKRIQAPPVLAVKRRAFGFDHREAQMGPHFSAEYQRMKREALGGQSK